MRLLLTGATGFIGSVVLRDLVSRGDTVRAVTSKTPPEHASNRIEWLQIDLGTAAAADMDALVSGCDAVLHVAAEKHRPERMQRVNSGATRLLVDAAERAAVPAFCYVSTVSVYGSGRGLVADETSPVLTADRDVASEYQVSEGLRTYGRTKLGGELAIRAVARSTRYVILRPAVVVDLPQILGGCDWSRLRRFTMGRRRTQHVYVRDVSDAVLWSLDRMLVAADRGLVETFNVSDDDADAATHARFLRRVPTADRSQVLATSSDPRALARELVWFARSPRRRPLWRMRFPATRLRTAGFRPRFGMQHADSAALRLLGTRPAATDQQDC